MDLKTCAALAELNRAFYAKFAADFARTRRGWPPGFERILPYLRPIANVLDLGCGNGRLLAFLAAAGWRGRYVGVDSSPELLAVAAECAPSHHENVILISFLHADLQSAEWPAQLRGYLPDAITALAVLHHIPGAANRGRFLAQCAGLLPAGGLLILSTWQFASTPRLRARILPWETIGLKGEDVEPGDHLMAWGEGAAGQRYCAAINEETLYGLAAEAGLAPVETFYADGHEGNLNLYGVFMRG
jgi:SAM-dependent methyltransferase